MIELTPDAQETLAEAFGGFLLLIGLAIYVSAITWLPRWVSERRRGRGRTPPQPSPRVSPRGPLGSWERRN